jgi:hypothetical protein
VAPVRPAAAPAPHTPAAAVSHDIRGAELSLSASANAPRALLDHAAADPSLHAAAIGNNAHLRLETANAGSLSLHLHVRDGVADVEVEGTGARSLDLRPQEIRRALAGEGLTLGRFETRAGGDADGLRAPEAGVSASSNGNPASSNGGSNGSGSPNGQDGASSSPPSAEQPRSASPSFSSTSNSSSFNDGRRSWNSDGSDGRDRDSRSGGGASAGSSSSTPSSAGPRRRRGVSVMA